LLHFITRSDKYQLINITKQELKQILRRTIHITKIKAFRRQFRGVADINFFLYRVCKINAYGSDPS